MRLHSPQFCTCHPTAATSRSACGGRSFRSSSAVLRDATDVTRQSRHVTSAGVVRRSRLRLIGGSADATRPPGAVPPVHPSPSPAHLSLPNRQHTAPINTALDLRVTDQSRAGCQEAEPAALGAEERKIPQTEPVVPRAA